ncbi:DUF1758 domain-containing protein [Trichonephila clavipes]|uniref:DUF1758 domain-containing protein n=1 Tax=Trichonephila clavipes TaxID=2585209 RepID=A0A8X6RKR6_TRICX|nr:DUF1758 domain-containing protein [Trichonephila clavipes]
MFSEKRICGRVPKIGIPVVITELNSRGIVLSDLENEESEIDILIGANVAGLLFMDGCIELQSGLFLLKTRLGYVLTGRQGVFEKCNEERDTVLNVISFLVKELPVNELWNLESIGIFDPIQNITTKIRPVFDASARATGQSSLNDLLYKGPNLIEQIPDILDRFRRYPIGHSADIEKAFLQLGITPKHRDFLRFFYPDEGEEIVYRHCRVVFGVSSSPFLLAAMLAHLLENVPADDTQKIDELKDQYYDIKDISESELQVVEADIQSMEDRLEELEVRIRDILNSFIAKSSVSSVHNHENAISQANSKLKLEIKLPEIPLPVFRGRYDEWPSFKSQFDNIITNNNDLSESQKLYYLKASLQGDAKLVEAVDDSFESLITALKTRFENKRLLTETHINAILEIEKLTSESARDIRTMTDILSKNIRALKLLGFERNNLSDLILLNIILKKIDRETRKQFEQSIDSNQIPELDTFIMFLEKEAKL